MRPATIELQRHAAIDVEIRPSDKGAFSCQQLNRTQIVCFNKEFAVGRNFSERAQIRFRLNQFARRQHHLLAAVRQALGDLQPISHAHLEAFAAHGFAEVHAIDRPRGNFLIERQHFVARPIIEQGAE